MKSLVIGLPVVIACLVAWGLALACVAMADAYVAAKNTPSEHVEGSSQPPG